MLEIAPLSNQIKGILLEYGMTVLYRITHLRKMLSVIVENKEGILTLK